MPLHDLTEEEATLLFAHQINALAAEGPHPDCEQILAEIIAENEAECLRMEQEIASAAEEIVPRSNLGS